MVTRKCTHSAVALAAALLFAAVPARADDDSEAAPVPSQEPAQARSREPAQARSQDPSRAVVHHAPISSATGGQKIEVSATIEMPYLVRGVHVVYRTSGKWYTVRLLRSEESAYTGEIPADHVKTSGLVYAIEAEGQNGEREPIFASRSDPHPVFVHEDTTDERERWLLERVDGRRSVVSVTGELVRFGTTQGRQALPCAEGQQNCPVGSSRVPQVDDQYWRAEASYTYRPLRAVSEFGFRLGVVRGRSLVDVQEYNDDSFDVGLNYAGANVRFRLASILHTDLELLGSVTEIGFSTGAGAAVVLGDPLAFKFTLGWQTIGFTRETYFGTRFYTRLDLPLTTRITLAPNIEVTDMPHAGDFGVRLLADGGFVIGKGFTLWIRGGYQARISRSGGPAVGATVQYGF